MACTILTPIATPSQGGRPERSDLLFFKLLYCRGKVLALAGGEWPTVFFGAGGA